ncbi:peptidylprolyl isomerase [Methylophaga sp. OBS4]|uniref:peptidylprolyl isomerase n=1 Tax=Methylophaga sp. OBS4 TaxID=2991935 RepID=UPI002255A3A8|nr:peptidylprolyl isomerase [Methylophaga sp. OBS4]MCX4188525.1 peptidylprolyl isomerase [Methylophaga sp. OBS4]
MAVNERQKNGVIKVNGVEIFETDILKEMQYHPAASQEAAYQKAAQCLVIDVVLRQQAEVLGINITNTDKTDYLDTLIAREVSVPQAAETECRQYYQANPEKFLTSPLVAARHILLAAHPDDLQARTEALKLAELLIEKLSRQPDFFAKLARQHSLCDSAKQGGQLGQLSRGQTVPEFERQLFAASPGLIRRPVETRFGFHVVSVDQRIEGEVIPYQHVADRIAEYLNERVQRKAVAQYIEVLLAEADIEGIDLAVSGSPLMQ